MLLQRLATGATGVKQARYRQGPTRGSEALVRACAGYTQPLWVLVVQCETMHGVYEFRRGFCTLVLSLTMFLQIRQWSTKCSQIPSTRTPITTLFLTPTPSLQSVLPHMTLTSTRTCQSWCADCMGQATSLLLQGTAVSLTVLRT